MRNFVFLWMLGLILTSGLQAGNARSGQGMGVILGDPTGLSGKIWLGPHTAVDGAVAWSFRNESAFHIHGDYLFHNFGLFKIEKGILPLYYGIGGRIKLENDTRVGVRLPVGMNYLFQNSPLDIFLEVVPILELIPATEFNFNAALGARFFF